MPRLAAPSLVLLTALAAAAPGPATAAEPAPRRAGDLVVHDPPRQSTRTWGSRLRAHVDGALSKGSERTWVGPAVPAWMPLSVGTRELFLLDPVDDGWLAFYRDPYGAASCRLGTPGNCAFEARLYGPDGALTWAADLSSRLSRPTHLEIQDARYADGTLYYNEACQSYSREAGRRCSALVALDPVAGVERWRTKPLTSNNVFLVLDRYLVAGYGFTAEPDALFLVDRATGRIAARARLPKAHQALSVDGDLLAVEVHDGETLRFRLVGLDGTRPRLVPLRGPAR